MTRVNDLDSIYSNTTRMDRCEENKTIRGIKAKRRENEDSHAMIQTRKRAHRN